SRVHQRHRHAETITGLFQRTGDQRTHLERPTDAIRRYVHALIRSNAISGYYLQLFDLAELMDESFGQSIGKVLKGVGPATALEVEHREAVRVGTGWRCAASGFLCRPPPPPSEPAAHSDQHDRRRANGPRQGTSPEGDGLGEGAKRLGGHWPGCRSSRQPPHVRAAQRLG